MLKRIIVASLVALASPAFAQSLLEPPAGMVWQTTNGLCTPSDGDIDGCAYGPAGSNRKEAFSYFRVCGQIHEARPFLVVDLEKRTFNLDRKNGRPIQIWPFRAGAISYTPADVAAFADMVEDKGGVCLAA